MKAIQEHSLLEMLIYSHDKGETLYSTLEIASPAIYNREQPLLHLVNKPATS